MILCLLIYDFIHWFQHWVNILNTALKYELVLNKENKETMVHITKILIVKYLLLKSRAQEIVGVIRIKTY